MSNADNIGLAATEARIQARSAGLRKELGIVDLALAQIVYIVTLEFFGTAARAGPSHVVLWLVAIAFFFVPQALVVAYLNRLMPLEGGLYEWVRIAFNDRLGFMVAWNLWLYVAFLVAEYGFVGVSYIAFALGPRADWMVSNKLLAVVASSAMVGGLVCVSALGLRIGKWVSNVGGILTLAALGVLIGIPVVNFARGTTQSYHPLRLVNPGISLFSLSVFSKMTFGALCGFEFIAIFGGECRDAGRNLRRSVLITAPVIAFLYIFVTGAILSFTQPGDVNLIAPVPQALSSGLQSFGVARVLAPLTIILLLGNCLATANLSFSASARLPMVAGWDDLLPAWFTRLHRTYKTPINSIFFVGAVTLGASIGALIGVNEQEAFSLIQIWGFTLYGLAYLAMFAIPLVGSNQRGMRPKLWLQVAAASGFLVTLLFVVLSIFPVVDVADPVTYAWKTVGVIAGTNIVGALVYAVGRRRPLGVASAGSMR